MTRIHVRSLKIFDLAYKRSSATGVRTLELLSKSSSVNTLVLGVATSGAASLGGLRFTVGATAAASNIKSDLEFHIGAFSSATAGSGIPLSAAKTAAFRVYADDGGAKLAAGEKRASISRFLYATADTDATDQTMSGHVGQVKVANNLTINGNLAGLCGYLEVAAAKTLVAGRLAQASVAAAVWGRVDVPETGVIGTDAYVSAFAASGNLGGTHTGKAAVISVPNPHAGAWDVLLNFGSAPGFIADAGAGGGTSKYLKCLIDGVAYSILVKSDA